MAYSDYGSILIISNHLDKAVAALQKALELDPNNEYTYARLSTVFGSQNKPQEAISLLRQGIKLTKEDTKKIAYLYNQISYSLFNFGQETEALQAVRQAIALQPDEANYYDSLGELLTLQGNYKEARTFLDKAIALAPRADYTYRHLSNLFRYEKKWQEALTASQKAVELNPTNYTNQTNLGFTLATIGQLDRAIPLYQQVIRQQPLWTTSYYYLGEALRQQKHYDKDAVAYQQALRRTNYSNSVEDHKPVHANAYDGLGQTLQAQGNLKAAIQEYRKALALDPRYSEAKQNLARALTQNKSLPQQLNEK